MIQIEIKNHKELAVRQSKLHALVPAQILNGKVEEVIVAKLREELQRAGVEAIISISALKKNG